MQSFKVENQRLFKVRLKDRSLFTGCRIFTSLSDNVKISWPEGSKNMLFYDLFYEAPKTIKSGMHHPDGMLWIKSAEISPELISEKIALRAVAPMILKLFDIKPKDFMVDVTTLLK